MRFKTIKSTSNLFVGVCLLINWSWATVSAADPRLSNHKTTLTSSSVTYTPTSRASESDIQQRTRAMNQFALELYPQLVRAHPQGNMIFSPLSVQGAFALLYPATSSHEPAGQEIATTMHFNGPTAAFHDSMKGYLLHLDEIFAHKYAAKRFEWRMANQVWVDKRYGLQSPYLDTIKEYYDAGVGQLDLIGSPQEQENSRRIINNYVAEQTKSMIQNLLPAKALNSESRTVLTNSVYMLADWAEPFTKYATYQEPFFQTPQKPITVPMMHRTGYYGYMENSEYAALSMPYIGREIAMLVILPRESANFDEFAESWQADKLALTMQQLGHSKVRVSLPKFTFSWGSTSLRPALQTLGLRSVFSSSSNPLDHLLTFNNALLTDGIAIKDVIHQAKIIVDEKGTEAAAATGVTVVASSAAPLAPIKVFKVDHPALFVIYDTKYAGIIFMGHLANPLSP